MSVKSASWAGGLFRLKIGGFGILFKSDQKGIISVIGGRYGRFSGSGRADYQFEVSEAPGRREPFKPAIISAKDSLVVARGDFEAVLDLRSGKGTLKAAPTEQCLDAFLRSFLSTRLLGSGGLMLHSAGLVKNGRAYLFLGKSGAGKSTLAKLAAAAGAEVISDEINLLRPGKGGFRVYGSPFWGEMRADGRPGNWPLGGIFLLKKAKANAVRPCSKPAALKLLLRCLLNFDKTPGTAERVLENSFRLLGGVKFSGLEFTKNDAGFLELI